MSEQRNQAVIRQFPRQAIHGGAAPAVRPLVPDAAPLRPVRLACGGAVHAGPGHRTAWWIEPLAAVIVVAVVAGLIGVGLLVVGR